MILLCLLLAHASERPAPLPEPLPAPPAWTSAVERRELSTGFPVHFVLEPGSGTWDVALGFAVGSAHDPWWREGLSQVALVVATAADGTLGADLAALGAELDHVVAPEATFTVVSGVARHRDAALRRWGEELSKTRLPRWSHLNPQVRMLSDRQAVHADSEALADLAVQRAAWGDSYAGRPYATYTVAEVKRRHVRRAWRRWFTADHAALWVSGDLDPDAALPLLEEVFGPWSERTGRPTPELWIEPEPTPRVWAIQVPGAVHSAVRSVAVLAPAGHADHEALRVANEVLGGSFDSRLNMLLREERGLSYGPRCALQRAPSAPLLHVCSAQVPATETGLAVELIGALLAEVVSSRPLAPERVEARRDGLVQMWPHGLDGRRPRLQAHLDLWVYGLPEDGHARFLERLGAVTADDANRALQTWLRPDAISWVVVGDEAALAQLDALGLPVVAVEGVAVPWLDQP